MQLDKARALCVQGRLFNYLMPDLGHHYHACTKRKNVNYKNKLARAIEATAGLMRVSSKTVNTIMVQWNVTNYRASSVKMSY